MASKNLGTLTLDLVAKIGGFSAGLDKAERESAKAAAQIEKNLQGINTAAVAVGTALGEYIVRGIDAIASAFPRLIENAAQFQDIAEKTGASAEGFASLAVSAKVGGVSLEELSAASVRLTKNLTGVDDESKAAGAALAAIGLNIKDFKALAPEQQFLKIAQALDGFEDGAEKTAVAVAALGKSGAELLPFFKELATGAGIQKILTAEQIKQADDYADRLARQKAQLELYASALATQTLPAITAFTGALKDLIVEVTGVGSAAGALAANNGMQAFAENAGRALAGLVDYIKATTKEIQAISDFIGSTVTATGQLLSGNLSQARQTGADFRSRYGLDAFGFGKAGKDGARTFVQQFEANLAAGKRSSFAAVDPRRLDIGSSGTGKPRIDFSGAVKAGKGGGAKDDPTKALLDNELKALENQVKQEQELLQSRNKFLDLYNGQGLVSVSDYYKQKQTILDDAVAKQSAAYDAEIAALQKYIASAPKATERAAGEGKLNDVIEKQAKLHREAGLSAIESSIKQVEAQKKVQAAVDEVNAKILEFNGNLREAAAIRFDAQNEGLKNTFTAEGNALALKQLETLRSYTLAQADLTKTTQAFALAQGDLSIAEERIEIARKRGTMGEIEALNASGEARRAAVAVMEKHLAVLLAINEAARSPEQNQQIERLKVQLEGLKATIDPLADKFNTLISDAAGNAFGDYITGAKSAKDAFKDFANSVINDISRMVAKNLAQSLFGSIGGSSGGGIGGFLSSLFGGGGGNTDVLGAFIAGKGFASGGFTGTGAANDPMGFVHANEYVLDADSTRRIGVSNLDRVNSGGSMGLNQTNNFTIVGRQDRRSETQIANKVRQQTITAAARF